MLWFTFLNLSNSIAWHQMIVIISRKLLSTLWSALGVYIFKGFTYTIGYTICLKSGLILMHTYFNFIQVMS